ncbi:hypothetical protein [Enterobacter roggenkampii]|uniref:hypothetical protein n=1 Tax=Enterobacter roggenkampii TaxID=1812935 RepID=UPI001FD77171|nr:hypothetical protein [Enterobacter roggenkampii]
MAGAEPVHANVSGHAVYAEPFTAVRNGEVQQHRPIAGSFYLDEQQNQYQLVSEDVTISITGLRNAGVEDFRYVQQYTLGDDAEMGVMNIPVVQDERVTQNELNIIAMRKPSSSKSTITSSACGTSRAS